MKETIKKKVLLVCSHHMWKEGNLAGDNQDVGSVCLNLGKLLFHLMP
jgi:hypothetical protein